MTAGHRHHCQPSDDAEAALWNLALFGHLSGDNRRRLGYPTKWRIQALYLSGQNVAAHILTNEYVRDRASAPVVEIPHQRTPPSAERIAALIRRHNLGGH